MKNFCIKIAALLMVFTVLFSTLSFTVQKHICAGEVVDVAFFDDLERCGMPDESNHDKNLLTFKKQSCCQDKVQFVEATNAEIKVDQKLKVQTQVFATIFNYTYYNLFKVFEKNCDIFLKYSPPNVIKDIPVLYATFLI